MQPGYVEIDNVKITWDRLVNIYSHGWPAAHNFYCKYKDVYN
jgi:hypothetical protein